MKEDSNIEDAIVVPNKSNPILKPQTILTFLISLTYETNHPWAAGKRKRNHS